MTAVLSSDAPGSQPQEIGRLDGHRLNTGLLDDVASRGEFDATACMNCGVCTVVCPLGLSELPRRVFHDVVIGRERSLLAAQEAVYSCLLCRMCEVSCPAGVHITANVRTLRRYLNHRVHGL